MTNAKRLSFAGIRTNSVHERTNLVTIRNMARPYEPDPHAEPWRGASSEPFVRLVETILSARLSGKPVVWSMGAHVIKNGMSRYVIELVRHGFLTHVSGNGATSIHDFELAYMGETSEDVARSIEDGSFGMWEETGRYMNEAIQQGAALGLGYGPSLYRYLSAHPERFPHYDDCVFVQCQRYGVPYTCHISIGTDIIHQHPIVDFHALGAASGEDFRTMCRSVAEMRNGGVFLNFGSAISGPEIFLRALSLARNKGLSMRDIVAANFDIVPVTADSRPPESDPDYHYRPRRVLIDRLEEIGGSGFLFHGLHQYTIPALFDRLLQRKRELGVEFPTAATASEQSEAGTIPRAKEPAARMYPIRSRRSRLFLHQPKASAPLGELNEPTDSKPRIAYVPGQAPFPERWSDPQLDDFIVRLREAKERGNRILVSLGSHVIGAGVHRYLIDMIRSGCVSHLALTGAACMQDVELAAFGEAEASEPGTLAEGKLGMWQETGDIVHRALADGYVNDLGYGESLIHYAKSNPERFPYIEDSLIGACIRADIPYTCHITIGPDDVQLHPLSDFAVQGQASGFDFQSYCLTVAKLEGGVFVNFGSSVTGPEVFLKALSISRNLQYPVHHITTANFDIVRLGDYHKKVGYEDWDYYYRPRKNIVHRPTSLGGKGFHFEGLHERTIPAIWEALQLHGGGEERAITTIS
ncbi:hypothetical protein [Paenibacillus hemerocallicola]|uniref:hypothetical protein n=1 Tax=Paenibacillus hemerocallicola TaxID=1172614 RepID=UPI00159EF2F7|nr:hypothetical protein [Paenibacillus hemerocallicola]